MSVSGACISTVTVSLNADARRCHRVAPSRGKTAPRLDFSLVARKLAPAAPRRQGTGLGMGVVRTGSPWGILPLTILLAACSSGGGDDSGSGSANRAPTIAGTPGTTVAAGSAYSFAPNASDGDSDALIFGVDAKPPWALFNTATGQLSGTPAAGDAGDYPGITVWVSDGKVATKLPAFDLMVTARAIVNQAPQIGGAPPASVAAGATYDFTPTASDADGDTLTFSVRTKPAWVTFSATTGRLVGTPSAANVGNFPDLAIGVNDGQTTVELPLFSIAVMLPAGNHAPAISGVPPTSVQAGTVYAFTPTASDADGDTLTFSVANLPAWASFSAASGTLQGTPPVGTTGTFANVVLSVSDGGATVMLAPFSITVTPSTSNRPPSISGTPPTAALQGSAYAFQPSASDPDWVALTFSISNRPTWAAFNTSSGLLQGTPGAAHVGTTNNIVISVSDG